MEARTPETSTATPERDQQVETLLERAAQAQQSIDGCNQEQVDQLCRAVCWAVSNKHAFQGLMMPGAAQSSFDDPLTSMDDREKLRGILRDLLRRKSIGKVEENPERGLIRYAKPAGVVVVAIPTDNTVLTVAGQAMLALKARDAVIFCVSSHAAQAAQQTCELIWGALREQGFPADLVQFAEGRDRDALESGADRALHFGFRQGCSTMILDETADLIDACHMVMLSKTAAFGDTPSADDNLLVHESIYEAVCRQLEVEGGFFVGAEQRETLRRVLWDEKGIRKSSTTGVPAQKLAETAGISLPGVRRFLFLPGGNMTEENRFCRRKRAPLLALFRYEGEFENALNALRDMHGYGGGGVGIYSYNDSHIERLAMAATSAKVLVRQPQALADGGAANNGLPMTTGLGHPHLRDYLRYTLVSRPIAPDMPPPEELFGDLYDPAMDL